jgi:hypothetical protein
MGHTLSYLIYKKVSTLQTEEKHCLGEAFCLLALVFVFWGFFVCFAALVFEIQALMLAKLALYNLSNVPSPFLFFSFFFFFDLIIFQIGSCVFAQSQPLTVILLPMPPSSWDYRHSTPLLAC